MTLPSFSSTSSFALARIEVVIGRVFTTASLAFTTLALLQVLGGTRYLKMELAFASIGLVFAAVIFASLNFWLKWGFNWAYHPIGIAYILTLCVYPFSVLDSSKFPADYAPWIWWLTGSAFISVAMYFPKWWSIVHLILMPVSWFVLRTSVFAGSKSAADALMDSVFMVFYAVPFVTLIIMMRRAAMEVDRANEDDLRASRDRASLEATQVERSRVDDLIHDQVLTTLLLAAKAESKADVLMAAESASRAISRLEATTAGDGAELTALPGAIVANSLEQAISRMAPSVICKVSTTGELEIPLNVTIALTDATLQAVQNSLQHAGAAAQRFARIKVDSKRIKIAIVDTGKGFYPSRIPAGRMGITNSIKRRMIQVGAERPMINSAPRKGTTVVLAWKATNA